MNHNEQRKYAIKLLKDSGINDEGLIEIINNPNKCFPDIFKYIKDNDLQDQLIGFIDNSQWAYRWAYYIGNKDIMIDRVTESMWAFIWTITIGDKDIMIDKVTDPYWIEQWKKYIKE